MSTGRTQFLLPTSNAYPLVDAAVAALVVNNVHQIDAQLEMFYYNGGSSPDYSNGDPYQRLAKWKSGALQINFGRWQGETPDGKKNDTAAAAAITIGSSDGPFNRRSVLRLPNNRAWISVNIHGNDYKPLHADGYHFQNKPDGKLPLFLESGRHYLITSEVLQVFANWIQDNPFQHIVSIDIPTYDETQTPKEEVLARATVDLQHLLA
ncbi:MAG TPA: hypothetical protein V6C81_11050 [Planktothrix sp.]|jgi:hypothetical protein